MTYSIRVHQNLFLQKDGSTLGGKENALVIPCLAQAVDLLHQLKDLNPILVYAGVKRARRKPWSTRALAERRRREGINIYPADDEIF